MTDASHPAKKQRMSKVRVSRCHPLLGALFRTLLTHVKIIGTHNGTFHCDEALAVFLLRLTDTYSNAGVKRTRDPIVLDTCDIVVDVGAIYDEARQRFDHHQRGFTEVFGSGFSTKLSSAGLIYKFFGVFMFHHQPLTSLNRHFGQEIIAKHTKAPSDDPKVTALWLKMYKEFVEAIDAIDNGIAQFSTKESPTYKNRTDLSSRVGWLNPAWNETVTSDQVDSLFEKASSLTGEEFIGRLSYYTDAWLPGRDIVQAAFSSRLDIDPSGKILLFETFAPWKEHLFDLEKDTNVPDDSKPFYVIYPDETGNSWRVQAVPVSPDSFESRKALPEAWRGIRDAELSNISGVEGCIFIHASGFIGGNKTRNGALKLAQLALAT
ncbi:metal-dependent protein hydrolase [Coniophora puteana RWD-64-598 SS2]|uniref:Metal-dependent protein hydrolase n=1 Tax=Coniophora puteana (strain RWD-64-598) TaxID=741705 RepID=A0A5M3N5I6_CONPW|nr:metal-dependent protein hydrolase [Coniophora puteana RWD-64-598 SS2]EIW86682.1 metal-dependent protein hydrolase [Coniophora puteana RWD-64-598 SS2]